jgi:FkbM family methyltransferase
MRLVHEQGLVRVRACRRGVMAYLTRDEHIGRALDLYGEWAEAELLLLGALLKPGQVAVDVGANIGTHAVFFAQAVGLSGAVLAFEPQRALHQLLCANLALNAHFHVRALHAAAGATPGSIVVPDVDYAAGGNFGGLSLGTFREGERVPVLTLDGFGLVRCHLLKVDVEGMELQVLLGARETLRRCSPVLYVENNRPEGAPAVVELLLSLGYSLRWHFSPFFRADNFAGNAENVFGPLVDANMLAVPPALADAVAALPAVEGPGDSATRALRRAAARRPGPGSGG